MSERTCTIEDCVNPQHGHRSADQGPSPCSVDGCLKGGRRVRGMCDMHYARLRKTADVGSVEPKRLNGQDEVRFWTFVNKEGPASDYRPDLGPCWLWTGGLDGRKYGQFRADGRGCRAHRWSYEALVGPIPEGLTIDHLCRVKICVNPRHMEPVTAAENTRRMGEARTHCAWGHEFTPENIYISPTNGQRTCRACVRLSKERNKERARDQASQYRAKKRALMASTEDV